MPSIEALLSAAQAETQLDNFGDESFREGLERLVEAAESEAKLSASGRELFYRQIKRNLTNRLEIEHWYSIHPEIEDQQLLAPLIGLGLPRTGSTVFFQMLSLDEKVRTIRSWEGIQPCPPPVQGQEDSDPRLLAAVKMLQDRDTFNPALKTMLPSSATSALECGIIMANDFKSNFFVAMLDIPSYTEWLINRADLTPTYRYLKRVLKLLQWRCPPRRWRLKSPPHSLFINDLNKVFPDAKFWMTHRDVSQLIPSVSDLYFENRKRYCDNLDKKSLGALNVQVWSEALKRMISFRDHGEDHRFFDVYFEEVQTNPIPVIHKLYQFLGEPLEEKTIDDILAWRKATPKGKDGFHHYTAEEYGLDAKSLQSQFEFYNRRFGLD